MKSLIAIIAFIPLIAFAGGEMKKVCHQEKGKEVCKTIKVHKKFMILNMFIDNDPTLKNLYLEQDIEKTLL